MEIQETPNKFLNLVFENWENNKPTPNCPESVGNLGFNYPDGFFDFYERYYFEHLGYERNSIPIKNWKLKDISQHPDKNFYFALKTSHSLNEVINQRGFDLSENVKNNLKEFKNFYFMYIREHESETEEDILALQSYIKNNNLPEEQFLILTNNFNYKNIITKNNLNINIYKLNLLQITSTSIFSEMKSEFNLDKSGKFFICFNKNPKRHRYSLLSALNYYDILSDTNWSLIGKISEGISKEDFRHFFEDDLFNKIDFLKLKNVGLKESDYEIGKKYFNSDLSVNIHEELNRGGGASGGLMLPEYDFVYKESYLNIVTESLFEDTWNSIHITEKSFRPFHFYLFPIFVATHNHVKTIRDNFGFDLFDDIIDHSYDNEPNQKTRLKMILDEIIRIHKNKNKFIEFYKNNQDRFEKNKQIIKELSNNDSDFLYFKTLLS